MYKGISDEVNLRVFVQVKPNLKRNKVRGIQRGDVLGKVYSVVDERGWDECQTRIMNGVKSEWTREHAIL